MRLVLHPKVYSDIGPAILVTAASVLEFPFRALTPVTALR
jgi:hypothetical protein